MPKKVFVQFSNNYNFSLPNRYKSVDGQVGKFREAKIDKK